MQGTLLWTTPPIALERRATLHQLQSRTANWPRFGAQGTRPLMYDVALGGRKTVPVHEKPTRIADGDSSRIRRRFELGPADQELWFVAHAELGGSARKTRNAAAVVIQRSNDVLVAVAQGTVAVSWNIDEFPAAYEESLILEEKGESVVRQRAVSGRQTLLVLRIPAHSDAVAIEIVSATLPSMADAEASPQRLRKRLQGRRGWDS